MKVFLLFLLGPISTISGLSTSLSALKIKMPQTNSPQQGISNFQNSPDAKSGGRIEQNLLPRRAPQELLHQDVTQSVRLQEQVSQLSMNQLELSRRILSNILQLQTHLPKPLHTVMDTANNPASASKLLKNMEILKANMELFKPQQTNIAANTKLQKEPSTIQRNLGLAPSQDVVANKPALPQQTIVLVDTDPNKNLINRSSSNNSGASKNNSAQPQLADTIQPILDAIRSRMSSPISSQVHSSHPQLGKETASTSFVDHLKKPPITSQIQSANPNSRNQISQLQTTGVTNTISGSQPTLHQQLFSNTARQSQPSNIPSPFSNTFPHDILGNIQPAVAERSLLSSIPKVNNSSLMFVTLPSQLANANPLITSPPGNIPPATVKKSNFNNFGTDPSLINVQPNPIGTNPSNNVGALQNVPSSFGQSSSISSLNPDQSIGSIVTELQTLIAKLEFLKYDFKLAQLLQSNPALLSKNLPPSPTIKSPVTHVQGSLKKSPSVLPDPSASFNLPQRSSTQTNLNNHPINQSAFSQNMPVVQMILAAESQIHPVIQSIASASPKQPVSQRRIANTNQPMEQQANIPSLANNSNNRKFNLQPYSYTYHVRDAATRNYQSKTEIMSLIGDVFGAYAFVDPAGTVSFTSTYNISGATRHGPSQPFTQQQMFLPPLQ